MTEHAFARQIRPARPRLRTILGATVLAAGLSCAPVLLPAGSAFLSTSALAAEPMQITGTTVYDSTNSLGDTATLKSKISNLSKKYNVDLHVVTIDKFENPSTSSSWTKELATKNNWGSADVVLVIATESRQAYFLAGSTKTLSSDQQTKVYQNYIKPKLQNSDYAGAALAAVEGIEAQKSGSSSGVVTGVLGVGAAAAVGAGGYAMYRRRKKKNAQQQPQRSYGAPRNYSPIPEVPLEELRTRAGSALLQADTTMSHAKQELEFARAQYTDQQVAEFAQEIARAEDLMRKSFQRQQLLTDSIPDTEAEQRAWLTEIIDNSQEVTRIAQEQDAKLAQLRNLEQEAPQAIEALAQRLPQLRASVEEIAAQYRALKERYLPSALEPISKTPALLESNMVLCAAELEKAQATVATARSEAVAHLRTAEEAASQIQALGAAVNTRSQELEQAQLGLSTDLLSIQRDVAEAKSLAASQRRDDLGAVAAGMEAVLNQVNQSASARPNDPLTLANQLHQLSAELDKAMTNMRATRERSRAASQNLDRTMRSAYAAVNGARSYINNRRAAVGPMTLTAVSEAERHLGQAQRLASSDPLNAMKEANMAIQKATDAQNRAQSEVGNYYNNQNNRGGGSGFGGDLAKGLLLGALMTAINSGTSSWGSSGGHSSGGSSGGSWGGGGGFSGGGGGGWGSGGGDGGSF
ncbi:TPM domain-containing protein [uncultured Rothia sp.]|uniref:TPM domain-containing protein n=1 Tax=uncultured Rothia sp. TaxID=316088 RepID=UPI0028E5CD10|nr:TPM domain-containing protein [uncultured Rothia sp.]